MLCRVLRILLLSIGFIFFKTNAYSQSVKSPKNEIRSSYGIYSDAELLAATLNFFKTIFSGFTGEPFKTDYKMTGPFIFGYRNFISENIAMGPELNLQNLKVTDWYSTGDIINSNFFLINLSGRADFYFIKKENLQLYSGLALGPTFSFYNTNSTTKNDKSTFFFSYQINLMGIRFGKSWGGFIEFGIGRNGLTDFGISKSF